MEDKRSRRSVFYLIQRKMLDPVDHVLGLQDLAHQFQIKHRLSDRGRHLMAINESSKENAFGLPLGGYSQQILILSKEHAIEKCGPVQQRFIIQLPGPVFLDRQRIDAPVTKARGDSGLYMDVL